MQDKKLKYIELLFFCLRNKSFYYTINEPLSKLIFSFEDIEVILENEEKKSIIKLLYFCNKTIHKILYDKEKFIVFNNDNTKIGLDYYFYIDLLINEYPQIIDYCYSIDFLIKINEERNQKKDKFKIIILSKVIIDLIKNYKGTDEYNEDEYKEKLDKLEEENRQAINNSIYILNSIGLNYNEKKIEIKRIEEIFLDIINELLKRRKHEDFEYICNILNQLELLNINLTNSLINKLIIILNSKEKYVKD